ncbi:unnamed protein product [Nezara viridula]|uniref:Uncharacterized protein n=1 Tax=Nezara viridula TaxID=85310 RepID=A0A9P0H907_NEZVI|nr:unnamed protein product [Nezara viridula]
MFSIRSLQPKERVLKDIATDMVKMNPCHPTIGKIELVFNDIFKFYRMTGSFPIDSEYSGISKSNLVKVAILYLAITLIVLKKICKMILSSESMPATLAYMFQHIPTTIFFWVHLTHLIRNRKFLTELYEELMDIEYQMWKSDVCWSYKPDWFAKYLGVSALTISDVFILHDRVKYSNNSINSDLDDVFATSSRSGIDECRKFFS